MSSVFGLEYQRPRRYTTQAALFTQQQLERAVLLAHGLTFDGAAASGLRAAPTGRV